MRTIGLIGGMSWESTAVYYRLLNELARDRMGGLASADILLRSVDFAQIAEMQKLGRWDEAGRQLAEAARGLERAGASCIALCTNTMHKVADQIEAAISVPFLHIIDITGQALTKAGARRPLLLATAYTMEQAFYSERMQKVSGITPMVPDDGDRARVHAIIYDELCRGVVREQSRQTCLDIIERARLAGVDSVILGCTEIGLLIAPGDGPLPVFDTTRLHATAAMEWALAAPSVRAA